MILLQGIQEEKRRALEFEEEQKEQRRQVGKLAFQRWLRKQKEEDELAKKERELQRESKRLQAQERKQHRRRAGESFRAWKAQKDLEMTLRTQMEREERRALTPPARGTTTLTG